MGGKSRLILLVLAAVVAIYMIFLLPRPLTDYLQDGVELARGAGVQGALIFGLVYAVLVVALVPGSVLTLAAGYLYGPIWGTLLISPASVLGAALAFVVGRFFARDWISARLAGNGRFKRVDAAIGESGFRLIALLRLSPIFPFSLSNYALGLTQVRFRDYVLASWLGMLPGTFMYVYLGSLVTEVSQLFSGDRPDSGPWGNVLYGVGLLATVVVTVMVTRIARRALATSLDASDADGAAPTVVD